MALFHERGHYRKRRFLSSASELWSFLFPDEGGTGSAGAWVNLSIGYELQIQSAYGVCSRKYVRQAVQTARVPITLHPAGCDPDPRYSLLLEGVCLARYAKCSRIHQCHFAKIFSLQPNSKSGTDERGVSVAKKSCRGLVVSRVMVQGQYLPVRLLKCVGSLTGLTSITVELGFIQT